MKSRKFSSLFVGLVTFMGLAQFVSQHIYNDKAGSKSMLKKKFFVLVYIFVVVCLF